MAVTGTHCLTTHCAPALYNPPRVPDPKNVFPPICPGIAGFGPFGAEKLRIEDVNFTSKTPSLLSDTTSSAGTAGLDAFLAAANRNAVVATAPVGGHSFVVLVLFKCSTLGLAEQFVRIPIDVSQRITLETIRVRQPER